MKSPSMRIPILAYHSANVRGSGYADNDHVALAADLRTLTDLGWRVVPLQRALAIARGEAAPPECAGVVALTCDDGPLLDFEPLQYQGVAVPGFRGVFDAFQAERGANAQPELHMSCFVLGSPQARADLGRAVFGEQSWMGEAWWTKATRDGRFAIENHSSDHNHELVARSAHKHNARGRFDSIDTAEECEAEVAYAQDYIGERSGRRPRYFAYPWGQSSAYLRESWLPQHAARLGLEAAFGTRPDYLDADSPPFDLPRFVCGPDWRSPDDFARLLCAAADDGSGRLEFAELEDARSDEQVVALFQRLFRLDPPDFPRHYVSRWVDAQGRATLLAYVHNTRREGYNLGGGLVFDERAYRSLDLAARRRIQHLGGPARWTAVRCLAATSDQSPTFVYIGDLRSRRLNEAVGFRLVEAPYLYLRCAWPLDHAEEAKLIAAARAEGAF